MAQQQPKIVLKDLRKFDYPNEHFSIEKIFNSIAYRVGDSLHSNDVQLLIDQGWTVEVKRSQ